MSGAPSVTTWIGKLRDGDAEAAQRLWERYFARLTRVARGKLQGTSRRAADEEDVALSAFHSFCQAATHDRFPRLDNRDDLWQVLVLLTARKACRERERQHSRKRGGQVTPEGQRCREPVSLDDPDLTNLIAGGPDPAFVVLIAEQYQSLLAALPDDDLRRIARYRLEEYTTGEIAARLDCNRRTIERKVALIRACWEESASR
jgi:DNA-directed RNA polymerase specialized sigma24 family protein